jgi:hypothetical protein
LDTGVAPRYSSGLCDARRNCSEKPVCQARERNADGHGHESARSENARSKPAVKKRVEPRDLRIGASVDDRHSIANAMPGRREGCRTATGEPLASNVIFDNWHATVF